MATEKIYRDLVKEEWAAVPDRPQWVDAVSKSAYEEFQSAGLPHAKLEAWKYVPTESILNAAFTRESPENPCLTTTHEMVQHFLVENSYRLTFMNGDYCHKISDPQSLPPGVCVKPLSRAWETHDKEIKSVLEGKVETPHGFSLVNTFSFQDGAFFYVPKGVKLEMPVHLLLLNFGRLCLPQVFYPRIVVMVEEGAEAHLLMDHAGLSAGAYFMNAVMDIRLGKNAHLHLDLVQRELEGAMQVFTSYARQEANSHLAMNYVTHGGSLIRNESQVHLDGEAAQCEINALSVLSQQSKVFHHAEVHHHALRGESNQTFKNILTHKAKSECDSLVSVEKGAEKSSSHQLNRNLVLSKEARAYSRPQLKIDTDDVQCNHGSATGQLEAQELFYLRSRGLSEEDAKLVMTYGFAEEILQKIKIPSLRRSLEHFVEQKLEEMI